MLLLKKVMAEFLFLSRLFNGPWWAPKQSICNKRLRFMFPQLLFSSPYLMAKWMLWVCKKIMANKLMLNGIPSLAARTHYTCSRQDFSTFFIIHMLSQIARIKDINVVCSPIKDLLYLLHDPIDIMSPNMAKFCHI